MTKPLRIVFAGTPAFGLPSLDALVASSHELVAVYTQPDRPAGRGRKLQPSAVKQWALNHGVPVYQPLNFKDQSARDDLAALTPDVMVVIAYGLILPKAVLDIPQYGCINVHASLLPRWRGASPIQQALLHGDKQSGVTIMQMDVGMDTGKMLKKVSCTIQAHDTAGDLHDKLAEISTEPLIKTLDHLKESLTQAESQNDAQATYAPKISKEDAKINWYQPAIDIDRLIRAFSPWPIAFTETDQLTLRVHQASIIEKDSNQEPGTVVDINRKQIIVATAKQCIAIEKLQFSGGKAISVTDWYNAGQPHLSINKVLQ